MIRYGKALKKIRKKRNLRQVDIANAHNMSNFSYSSIERGRSNPTAPTVQLLLNGNFYTNSEKELLNSIYDKVAKEQIKNKNNEEYLLKIKKEKEDRVKKRRQTRKDERLIRNNPNFYKNLNNLGDLRKVDINDPKLQDIRETLSGRRYWKGEDY